MKIRKTSLLFVSLGYFSFGCSQAGAGSATKATISLKSPSTWSVVSIRSAGFSFIPMGIACGYDSRAFFATGSLTGNEIREWSTKDGKLLHTYKTDGPGCIACSPTSPLLFFGNANGGMSDLYNYRTFKPVWSEKIPHKWVSDAQFSKDGKYVVVTTNLSVQILSVSNGKVVASNTNVAGFLLALGLNQVVLLNVVTSEFSSLKYPSLAPLPKAPYIRARGDIPPLISTSNDRKLLLAVNSKNAQLDIYNLRSGDLKWHGSLPVMATGAVFQGDDSHLLVGTLQGKVFSLKTTRRLKPKELLEASGHHGAYVLSNPKGNLVFVFYNDGTIVTLKKK